MNSYLLFHSVAELLSVLVAWGILTVAWNSRQYLKHGFFLFLGLAYASVGTIDLVHTLTYKGMGVFAGITPNVPTQLWIAGRYVNAIALVLAPFFLTKPIRLRWTASIFVAVTAGLLTSIAYGWFPDCFREGAGGLTPFKVASEYAVCVVIAGAIWVLWRRRKQFDITILRLLLAAMSMTIMTELAFTLYADVYGLFNMLGHLLKIGAFLLLYKAIVVTGIKQPYDALFRDLVLSNEELVESRASALTLLQNATAARNQAERTSAQLREEISERERAEEALREVDKRKDEFLAMLAHELRNPLAPIRNAAQILKMAGADETVREKNRQIIERQASHMGRLLDDLLEVSRVTRGKIALKREPLDLRTIVTQAVEAATHSAQARRLDLCHVSPSEPIWVEGDFTRLEQVVGNLINNAIKYSDEGQIRVSLECEPANDGEVRYAAVRVRDTGIGISPEMLPRIFELFAQADQSLERQRGGLGIGLTMVKRLVDLHGGRVEAHSGGLGQGSEFAVFFPLIEKEVPGQPEVHEPAPEDPDEIPLKILVVDDNKDAAGSLKDLLQMWGYETRTAFDGPEAVQLALTFLPDVILLDIGLPGMSGFAVARKLREHPALESLIIIALTGYGQEEDRKMTSESGCDAHLVKPVDLHHLQTMLARIGVDS